MGCALLAKAVALAQLTIDITLWLHVNTDSARGKTVSLTEQRKNAMQTLQNEVCETVGKKLNNIHSAFAGAFLTFLLKAHGPAELRNMPEAQLVYCFDDPTMLQGLFFMSCISNCKEADRTVLKTLEEFKDITGMSSCSKPQSTKTEGEAKTQPNGSPAAPRPVKRIDALKSVVTESVSVHKGILTELAST